jgi:arylformamidase
LFQIDLDRYHLIDISYEVVPPGTDERPFVVQRGLLADLAFKYDVSSTHTHVGTHVESPAHFFEAGKSITDLPLTQFFGRGVLLPLALPAGERVITPEHLRAAIGDIVRPGDAIVARNDAPPAPGQPAPYFGAGCGEWLAQFRPTMFFLGNDLGMGADIEATRHFHDVLQSQDMCFVEFLSNLDRISRREFFVMALPFRVRGMDSGWARAIVLEAR